MGFDDELSELVADRGLQLTRLAYQLTHDRSLAQDVVQDALASTFQSWKNRGATPERLEAYVRRATVTAFLKRRRGPTELVALPTGRAGDCPDFDEQLAQRDAL